ncbi:MAG: Nif3-like dinuclear metal center hexameric protein [Lachnospiraceae bacterium]|nr:Nif3-like dinuclear metal center hexameric protein [Lachnospiraceae bacterium]
MKCSELIGILNDIADPSLCSEWDNSGLIVGDEKSDIKKVLIAVDATDEVIDEAVELDADMILVHHPIIFKGIKKVNSSDFTGRRVMKLIKNGIACFAMHTNFDISCMGDEAAERLGLDESEVLQYTDETRGFGRIGLLPCAMLIAELSDLVKKEFDLEYVKVFGDSTDAVRKIAIMPGSGASAISDAINCGAEVLITGDIDHHEGTDAALQGLIIMDAGHFGIEKIFIGYMKDYIERNTEGIKVYTDSRQKGFTVF